MPEAEKIAKEEWRAYRRLWQYRKVPARRREGPLSREEQDLWDRRKVELAAENARLAEEQA